MSDYGKREKSKLLGYVREEKPPMLRGWISLVNIGEYALTLLSPPYFWFLRSVLYYDLRPIPEQSHSRSYIFAAVISTHSNSLAISFLTERKIESGVFHCIDNYDDFYDFYDFLIVQVISSLMRNLLFIQLD